MMDQRWVLRSRRARALAGLLGLAAIALAFAAWASMGRAATSQFKPPEPAVRPGGTTSASSTAAGVTASMFIERCDASLRLRDAAKSIAGCTPFLADAALAPQANAALAVAYMFQDPPSPKESARHAGAAADAGNLTGSTLLVMHALRGDAGVTMSMQSIWATLQKASAMPQLRALHGQVGAAMRCREVAQFRLRDKPVFCMLRTEVVAWARESGMEGLKGNDDWSERYRATGLLPGVRTLEVAYDRDATTGLYTPAALTYRLDADNATDPALQDIIAALDAKYQRTGRQEHTWSAADGVAVTLRRNGTAMALRYELPQRVESARRHALEEAQQLSKARIEKAKAVL